MSIEIAGCFFSSLLVGLVFGFGLVGGGGGLFCFLGGGLAYFVEFAFLIVYFLFPPCFLVFPPSLIVWGLSVWFGWVGGVDVDVLYCTVEDLAKRR